MRIEATHATPPASGGRGVAAAATPPGPQAASGQRGDAVPLSCRDEQVRRASAAAKAAADARARRVAELRAQVKSGAYAIDNVEVAKALLNGS